MDAKFAAMDAMTAGFEGMVPPSQDAADHVDEADVDACVAAIMASVGPAKKSSCEEADANAPAAGARRALSDGMRTAKQAVRSDRIKRPCEALALYSRSLDSFAVALEGKGASPHVVPRLLQNMASYLDRAEQLQARPARHCRTP